MQQAEGIVAFYDGKYKEAARVIRLKNNKSIDDFKNLKKCYKELNNRDEYYEMMRIITEK